ncbi:HD domain-containing protein|uniref:HD-GYP domain, c-di-GMP phosphodiesterase class II (Or its inactivated variant) n=1 Tax=Dendrosporobacter quercicolus TaxID=146817 RepID=A0A1G9TNW7_9FIRM|nr:HD domain-containing phosphohydrolase [Dendrosporobacter quercicolus]NSL48908.1 HD domain-containing protein [Dendrosporobacter quercicolus DSM 1736]SDM49124.1 HD-GYP domain, c-di-GMP phosphodiesterase class II (or its inactivated variant) [Dendrosporobacter quercicolus]
MHIANAVPGMVLAQDLFDDYGNLLLEKGITLTESYIERLKKLGIRALWIEDSTADALKIDAVSPQLRSKLAVYFRTLFNMKFNDIINANLRNRHFAGIAAAADTAITEVASHEENLINLKIRYPSTDEANHAINVCLLSLVTGIYLKLPRPVLRQLAMGALLHDIGKSAACGNQPDSHARQGYNLLLTAGQSHDICRIAAEHHEAYDGTGLPARLSGKSIHPLARLVAIANYYDNALRSTLTTDIARQEIIETMLSQGNTVFDLNLLRAFFHTIALYPVGSFVRLSTGQSGYVIKNHAQFPLRPLVRAIAGEQPVEINLLHKPAITITELIKE